MLIEGPPGSGKTTIALQFLLQAVRQGETSLLVSNAEAPAQLTSIAASHGWRLDGIHTTYFTQEAAEGADESLD